MAKVRVLQNVFSGGALRLKAGDIVEIEDAEGAKLVRRGQAEPHTAAASEDKPAAEKGKKGR